MNANQIKEAKKRRARLFKEFIKSGWTKTKLAEKHGVSSARMWQLLKKAKQESV